MAEEIRQLFMFISDYVSIVIKTEIIFQSPWFKVAADLHCYRQSTDNIKVVSWAVRDLDGVTHTAITTLLIIDHWSRTADKLERKG